MVPRKRPNALSRLMGGLSGKEIVLVATSLGALGNSIRGDVRVGDSPERAAGAVALAQSAAEASTAALDSLHIIEARVRVLTARVRALENGKKLAEHPELYLVGPPVPPKRASWWPWSRKGD